MQTETKPRFLLRRGRGDRVWLGGLGVDFKVSGSATSGALSIVEHPVEPNRLVPPHVHTREDELSFVIEGEMGVRIGSDTFLARAGDYVLKPRDIPHTFWNPGPARLRILELIWPPSFDSFFRELAGLYDAGGGRPDPGLADELAARYGCTFYFDWVPELKARYGLRLLGE
jgi:mannose-6-phosphate isomerase-like protein (cupin superfamily)